MQLPKTGIHIIGIGGAGMSAIARVLVGNGYEVSGSDAKDSKRLMALDQLGIKVTVGHAAANVENTKLVIASTAISQDNIEITTAKQRSIPVWSRAEALQKIVESFDVIAVAGTHGKTTTTSMLAVMLQSVGLDPSFIIGSELNETGSNGHAGSGELFLVEADESDGTFLSLKPALGVITNIEADHLDRWESLAQITAAFITFASNCQTGLVVCYDDAGVQQILPELRELDIPIISYGFKEGADLKLTFVKSNKPWIVSVRYQDKLIGSLELQVPGQHNLLNAAAAIGLALLLNLDITGSIAGLTKFAGSRRRFELRGTANQIAVYDDYAHHPTEVTATLTAARVVAGDKKVLVVFQPFRYYRINAFLTEFGQALQLADKVAVMETYAPGEAAIPGAGGAAVAAAIDLPADCVVFEPSFINILDVIKGWAAPGDIVLTLGAGDMAMLAPQLVSKLQEVDE